MSHPVSLLHLDIRPGAHAVPPVGGHRSLTLPYELRQRGRLRTTLDDGTPAGLFLERGNPLRGGEWLTNQQGDWVQVLAAPEAVSTALSTDPLTLVRAAYHLGNRHVPVQIGEGWLRYLRDHVLDAMLAQLGLRVQHETAAFEPESGAYTPHAHGH